MTQIQPPQRFHSQPGLASPALCFVRPIKQTTGSNSPQNPQEGIRTALSLPTERSVNVIHGGNDVDAVDLSEKAQGILRRVGPQGCSVDIVNQQIEVTALCRQSPHSADTHRTLQTLTALCRQSPHSADSHRTLQTVTALCRQSPHSADSHRTLQTVTALCRQSSHSADSRCSRSAPKRGAPNTLRQAATVSAYLS